MACLECQKQNGEKCELYDDIGLDCPEGLERDEFIDGDETPIKNCPICNLQIINYADITKFLLKTIRQHLPTNVYGLRECMLLRDGQKVTMLPELLTMIQK